MAEVKIIRRNNVHFLIINGIPQFNDNNAHKGELRRISGLAYGDVLAAGYGFGIIHKFLRENEKVKSVTTIELHQEVIDEAEKIFGKVEGEKIIGNFFELPEDKKYDCIIVDIENAVRKYSSGKHREKAEKLIKPDGKIFIFGEGFLNKN